MDPIFIWFALLVLFLYLKRKNIERHGIIFMLKNTKLADKLYSFSQKHLKGRVEPLFDLGIILGFLGMLYAVKLLLNGAISFFAGSETSSVSVIIPGVQIPGSPIFLPLLQGVIAIAVLAIVHEFSHAIAASIHNHRPKSVAMVLLAFIPAAGVELDDKKVAKLPLRAKLRIFAGGSFANFLAAAFFILLSLGMVMTYVNPVGIGVLQVENNTPAYGVLENGTIITTINGVKTIDKNEFLLMTSGLAAPSKAISFSRIASSLKPGEQVTLETLDGRTITITLAAFPDDPDRGRIGIITAPKIELADVGGWLPWLLDLFHWIILLNIGVGMINLLPAPLFDGGRMFQEAIASALPKQAPILTKATFAFSLTLLILNLAPTIIKLLSILVSAIVGFIIIP